MCVCERETLKFTPREAETSVGARGLDSDAQAGFFPGTNLAPTTGQQGQGLGAGFPGWADEGPTQDLPSQPESQLRRPTAGPSKPCFWEARLN